MTDNEFYSKYIEENLSAAVAYEQLAEECSELTQAALKIARFLRGENPTAKSFAQLENNLTEEISDVSVCLDLLSLEANCEIKASKLERWYKRLKEKNTLKIGDKVKINDKFGLEKKYAHCIFEVASAPEIINGNECVKLKGTKGGWRVDGLELIVNGV